MTKTTIAYCLFLQARGLDDTIFHASARAWNTYGPDSPEFLRIERVSHKANARRKRRYLAYVKTIGTC